ncbi:hypothetical protein ASPWEDRAFT_298568 [Aspergillus wentii DTO 134E9]|uniref:Uncharacterized protein n=1 Tax=Aspergillus wentii DTO 134E9 TaxID=1073089 RepID=A0A1L9R4N1_ASPWE|nr:uncharacterized protein ASPWEDRAFT_298568 [Aspergillus wentii DTO 134E9]OJJ29842.1 hypothetical protein ASPWEDRAFT_298568 [Aspergillus wentii DTO 134E9]
MGRRQHGCAGLVHGTCPMSEIRLAVKCRRNPQIGSAEVELSFRMQSARSLLFPMKIRPSNGQIQASVSLYGCIMMILDFLREFTAVSVIASTNTLIERCGSLSDRHEHGSRGIEESMSFSSFSSSHHGEPSPPASSWCIRSTVHLQLPHLSTCHLEGRLGQWSQRHTSRPCPRPC